MGKKQHYACCAYLRGWETEVIKTKEPNKPFIGIYLFKRNNFSRGEAKTVEKVLENYHTYTVSFEMAYLFERCPKIGQDFAQKIEGILKKRDVNLFVNGVHIHSKEDIIKSFEHLDNWQFYHRSSGSIASRKAIMNQIRDLNSYLIEDTFANESENNWKVYLKHFIDEISEMAEDSTINKDVVMSVIKMLIYMLIRNPKFDCFSVFPYMKDLLSSIFLNDSLLVSEHDQSKTAIEHIMRALWLTQVYNSLLEVDDGVFHVLLDNIEKRCQVIVFHVQDISNGCFITSDVPAFFYRNDITSKKNNGIYFPLTSQYLLMIGNSSGGAINQIDYRIVKQRDVIELNRIIYNSANQYIVSSFRDIAWLI